MLFKSLATLLPLAQLIAAAPGSWYSFSNVPLGGFDKVSSQVYLDSKTYKNSGYFVATQWQFANGQAIYWGFQPAAEKGLAQKVIFSGFGNGVTRVDSGKCTTNANGGPGSLCSVSGDYTYDTWYTFEIENVENRSDGGHRWKCTLTNQKTGAKEEITSLITSLDYGKFHGGVYQYLDYYPSYNRDKQLSDSQKPCWEYGRVEFRDPVGNDNVVGKATSNANSGQNTSKNDKCAYKANRSNIQTYFNDNSLVIEAGFLPGTPNAPAVNPDPKPKPKCKCKATCDKRKRNGFLY